MTNRSTRFTLVLISVLSACSSDKSDSVKLIELSKSEFEAELANQYPPSPIRDALGVSPAESASFVMSTMQELETGIDRCMSSRGLPYEPHVVTDDLGITWLPPLSRRDFAASHGFGASILPTIEIDGVVKADPNTTYVNGLDAGERKAWDEGLLNPDGCRAVASQSLWGEDSRRLSEVQDAVSREVSSHAKIQSAVDDYIDCTTEAGFPWLNNPWTAAEVGLETARSGDITAEEEQQAAIVDLECRYPLERLVRSVQQQVESRHVTAEPDLFRRLASEIEKRF